MPSLAPIMPPKPGSSMTPNGVRLRLRLALAGAATAYMLGVHTPPNTVWGWVLFAAGFVGALSVAWRAFVDTSAADAPQADPTPTQAADTPPDTKPVPNISQFQKTAFSDNGPVPIAQNYNSITP